MSFKPTSRLRLFSVLAAFGCAACGVPAASSDAGAPPPLFPFLISYDAPDNAVNMAHLLDAPAGKHGFVRVENGRFVNDRGRVKLFATNLTGPANFPTHEQADKLADRLARFGINCVRLHYFDAEYGNFMTERQPGIFGRSSPQPKAFGADPSKPFRFDPAQIDRQDYLVAALKKRGIYVNMNLHVARVKKHVSFFDPLAIASEKEYARALLSRVNPYTGLAYTDDPCVALIEINNENGLFRSYHKGWLDRLPGASAKELQGQWNAWLAKKYPSTAAMRAAWKEADASPGAEQVPEGAFDAPMVFDGKTWRLEKGASETAAAVDGGVLRVTVTRDGKGTFPKIFRRVSLEKDRVYTVSFRVRRVKGAGEITLGFAVAKSQGGWKSLGLLAPYSVGGGWKTITHTFRATEGTDIAELQFTRFKTGVYEIDNLSLKRGAAEAAADDGRLENGSVPIVKNSDDYRRQARRDFCRFLIDTERDYWREMSGFVKNTLKAKAPVSGTQLRYSPPQLQAELDYVDGHGYWTHPAVGKNWRIANEPLVNSMGIILRLAGERVAGKPYTVSEFNCPFPNQYGAEGMPMLGACGALQGWDGIFEYTYNHAPDFEPLRNTYFFSMIARTEMLAHLPASAAMFLRGDVREARGSVTATMDDATFFEQLADKKAISARLPSTGLDARLALVHKVAMTFSRVPENTPAPAAPALEKTDVIQSDTGELTWNRERAGEAYWTVSTANTKCFTGFPAGREIGLGGNVKILVGSTRLNWATISLTSRHATGFGADGKPATILLAATGLTENEGTALESTKDGKTILRDRDWGNGTVLTEGVPAIVTLPSDATRTKCHALDERGARKAEVPVEKDGEGCRIEIGPRYKTVWYEIVVAAKK